MAESKRLSAGSATSQTQTVTSTKEVESPVVVAGADVNAMTEAYDESMEYIEKGMKDNVMQNGTDAEKSMFAEHLFSASMRGKQLSAMTGETMQVPDLYPDANGNIAVVMTDYEPPQNAYYTGVNVQDSHKLSESTMTTSQSREKQGTLSRIFQGDKSSEYGMRAELGKRTMTQEDRVAMAEAMTGQVLGGQENSVDFER